MHPALLVATTQPIEMTHQEFILSIIGISAGAAVLIILIIARTIRCALRVRAVERTRSEIAAYIAEGSMTPDEGERLLRADQPAWMRESGSRRTRCRT